MRVAVNLRQYFKGKIGGMENYVRNVLGGVAARSDIFSEVTVLVSESEQRNIAEFAPSARVITVPGANAARAIENELETGGYDLFFCPLLVLEPLQARIPSAVTIPDLQHEYYPEFFTQEVLTWRKQNFRPSVHLANTVFTISEFSKQTIVEKLGVPSDKVIVVDLDVDTEFREPSTKQSRSAFEMLQLPARYLYFPANFWLHKNHANLLRAMKILVESGYSELGLVFTGSSDSAGQVKKEIAKLGLNRSVRLLEYQPRSVVAEIYRHASALTFTSKFEGFGIPILEAFHTGCPVVCSGSCSCPEVAGDAAVLVDENDPEAIAAGVKRILGDTSLAEELVRKGRIRAEHYSWENAIQATIEALSAPGARAPRQSISVASWPLVSIVTPSYNMGRFLEETVQSVISQDYPHIEYVVMDGGSKDGTIEILNKYAGRLRYVSERDGGQAAAINKGFAATTGPIFAFLNADDTYLPGAVGKAATYMLENPYAGMLYGEAYYTDESGKILERYPTSTPDVSYLNRNCYICQPASFMRRDAFEKAGRMNEAQHYVLDYDLWMRMAKLFQMVKVDDYLATSRLHRDNKTLGQRGRVYREILRAVKTNYGYVPFDWTFGYSCYLADRKDQFFEKTAPSRLKYFLALAVGLYYNPFQFRRFCGEWMGAVGVPRPVDGRWSDGWISKHFERQYDIDSRCHTIRITGKHWGQFRNPLTITVRLNGSVIGGANLERRAPFVLELPCPAEARGRSGKLEISANRAFTPRANGDRRKLSCIIDEILFLGKD